MDHIPDLAPIRWGDSICLRADTRAFLTEEQHQLLEALPTLGATLESVITSYAATSDLFVLRGRALAEKTGQEWPVTLEDATRRHLERSIGRPIPDH